MMAICIVAAALILAHHLHERQIERLRKARRPLQQDAASVVDSEMLHGKFGDTVPMQDRQAVTAALKAPDQHSLAQERSLPGESSRQQRIILTEPVGTTVEDTEPTFTWDAPSEGWTYLVHIEDRDSHQTVAKSAILDEAIWRVSAPLLRGHSYLWSVEASPAGGRASKPIVTSATGEFLVLSDMAELQIKNARARNPSHLVLGSLYTHYQMWSEAVLEYRKLVSEAPDSPDAIRLLRNAELRSNAQLAAAPQ